MSIAVAADEFIKLHLDGNAVSVLGILNEEDHEEGDDGRSGIDDELPGIAEMKHRTGDQPRKDDAASEKKCDGLARNGCHCTGESAEGVGVISGFEKRRFQSHTRSVAPS